MTLPDNILKSIKENFGEIPVHITSVGGGCINNAVKADLSARSLFIKYGPGVPSDMYLKEAMGLRLLSSEEGPRVPEVLYVDSRCLILEYIETTHFKAASWKDLGRRLALFHLKTQKRRWGLDEDNYIGLTLQKNRGRESWSDFFAENRLGFQMDLAHKKGFLSGALKEKLEELKAKSFEFLGEPEFTSVLHGDLWSGNCMCDSRGRGVLIDPAVYYGHFEADLAMTELFSGFSPDFYRAYNEVNPLSPEYAVRKHYYNLYHMLNHVNLFGAGYLSSVSSLCSRLLC